MCFLPSKAVSALVKQTWAGMAMQPESPGPMLYLVPMQK